LPFQHKINSEWVKKENQIKSNIDVVQNLPSSSEDNMPGEQWGEKMLRKQTGSSLALV